MHQKFVKGAKNSFLDQIFSHAKAVEKTTPAPDKYMHQESFKYLSPRVHGGERSRDQRTTFADEQQVIS